MGGYYNFLWASACMKLESNVWGSLKHSLEKHNEEGGVHAPRCGLQGPSQSVLPTSPASLPCCEHSSFSIVPRQVWALGHMECLPFFLCLTNSWSRGRLLVLPAPWSFSHFPLRRLVLSPGLPQNLTPLFILSFLGHISASCSRLEAWKQGQTCDPLHIPHAQCGAWHTVGGQEMLSECLRH